MTQISWLRMAVLLSWVALAPGARAAAPTASPLSATDLPTGVKYEKAPASRLDESAAALKKALAEGPEALAALLGGHSGSDRVLMGPFFSLQAKGDGLDVLGHLKRFTYTITIDAKGTQFQAPGLFGDTPEQKRLLAQYLLLQADRSPTAVIRAANFDELSTIWYWISWDLDEPLLVYEAGNERLAFDFDPKSGRITWIERLTDQCFTGMQKEKQVLDCTCLAVARDKQNWEIRFNVLPKCANDVPSMLPASAANAATEPGRKRAVLNTSERTLRVDRMIAKQAAADYAVLEIPDGSPKFTHVGKLVSGTPPEKPVDATGKPIKGYVLVMHVIDGTGAAIDNRPLLYSDERLLAAVLAAAKTWRLEPATLEGALVTELVWQEFNF